jgi:hypothetical protein
LVGAHSIPFSKHAVQVDRGFLWERFNVLEEAPEGDLWVLPKEPLHGFMENKRQVGRRGMQSDSFKRIFVEESSFRNFITWAAHREEKNCAVAKRNLGKFSMKEANVVYVVGGDGVKRMKVAVKTDHVGVVFHDYEAWDELRARFAKCMFQCLEKNVAPYPCPREAVDHNDVRSRRSGWKRCGLCRSGRGGLWWEHGHVIQCLDQLCVRLQVAAELNCWEPVVLRFITLPVSRDDVDHFLGIHRVHVLVQEKSGSWAQCIPPVRDLDGSGSRSRSQGAIRLSDRCVVWNVHDVEVE